jgi:L-rhamnose mutarotase
MKRYCLTLDLKNDPKLIAEYKKHHDNIWPEITKSIRDAGISDMEIYLLGARLFMIIEADESFSLQLVFLERVSVCRQNLPFRRQEMLLSGTSRRKRWCR